MTTNCLMRENGSDRCADKLSQTELHRQEEQASCKEVGRTSAATCNRVCPFDEKLAAEVRMQLAIACPTFFQRSRTPFATRGAGCEVRVNLSTSDMFCSCIFGHIVMKTYCLLKCL